MYPSLTVILASMPILREDKIPTDGIFPAWSIGKVKEQMAKNKEGDTASESAENDDDQYSYSAPLSVRAEDTDAILVDRSGGIILQELVKFDAVAVPRDGNAKSSIAGDITAKWNREERRGVSLSAATEYDLCVCLSHYYGFVIGVCGSHLPS
jgi:hypothetical protein